MATNISKFVQLNDFLLLEYEFNKDNVVTSLNGPTLAVTNSGTKQFFETGGLGVTNNTLQLQSTPINSNRSGWYVNPNDVSSYNNFFASTTPIVQASYQCDTVRVHIVSGYNFDDITGFLLQVRALDTSNNLVDISDFTWIKQIAGNQVQKFATNTLYFVNRFYDKYVEFKVPSIQNLGGTLLEPIEAALKIASLSDVYLTYSTIPITNNNLYDQAEAINVQLPVISVADNFNCSIAESTAGDFIEYYATWNDLIIGEYISDIESGRIKLYTSNNPNDNYDEFTTVYGVGVAKWVVMHELYVYEHIPNGSSLLTQKFVFTQEDNWNDPNYFRPVIQNADIDSSYTIDYVCRLTNRMDGSQIIRKATFASTDPKKYGRYFIRINVENVIPYNIFNRLEGEASPNLTQNPTDKPKFVKVFYDTTTITLDSNNTVFPQGTGPLFLKKGDSVYKFKFTKLNGNTTPVQRENVDLAGAYNYSLYFVLDDDTKIEIPPTYSTNMNTVLGELEFKIMDNQIETLLKQINNTYQIRVKNPNGTGYTFYEGVFYSYQNFAQVTEQYNKLYDVNALQSTIAQLQAANATLEAENQALRTT